RPMSRRTTTSSLPITPDGAHDGTRAACHVPARLGKPFGGRPGHLPRRRTQVERIHARAVAQTGGALAPAGAGRPDYHHQRSRPNALRAGDEHDLRKDRHRSGPARIARADSQRSMSLDLLALKEEQSAARTARQRRSLDLETQSVVRVLPIRWRLLSIA